MNLMKSSGYLQAMTNPAVLNFSSAPMNILPRIPIGSSMFQGFYAARKPRYESILLVFISKPFGPKELLR
jgi:hypothetical protein